MRIPISGMLPEGICRALDLDKPYRAMQIFKALYSGITDFDKITTLPRPLRESLSTNFTLMDSALDKVLSDDDGNGKLSITLSDSRIIECVLLSDGRGRKTACLSTQAGCAMGCLFCKTGEGGFFRNLAASEITEQFIHLERQFGRISNIVFMGMGEPLDNMENLINASSVLNREEGAGIGYRKMTVSTCGLADKIMELADSAPPLRLAVSLNSALQEKRETIMPVARKFKIDELKDSLLYYQKRRDKRITLEYVLISGFNTGERDAKALRSFMAGLSAMVNLIPWNPAPGLDFRTPSGKETENFCRLLESAGIQYAVRRKKGRKIRGACGQLASENQYEDIYLDDDSGTESDG